MSRPGEIRGGFFVTEVCRIGNSVISRTRLTSVLYVFGAGGTVAQVKRIDRLFRFVEKHWKLTALAGLAAVAAAWFAQDAIKELINPAKPFFELMAVVFGPPITALGFYLGYRAKRDLVEHSNATETKLLQHGFSLSEKSADTTRLQMKLDASAAELAAAKATLDGQTRELTSERTRVDQLTANLERVTDGGHSLWKATPPAPFPEYYSWLRAPTGAKILTVGNLKGGVGKTTIAANLAAYVSIEREKPVLLIDLDYQGSLSNMMMFAAGFEQVPSFADSLFTREATLETLTEATVHLHRIMAQGWLVPASYSLGSTESRLLLEWLMDPHQGIDARYRLARLLLNPTIRQRYSVIIIDMPPRLTLGAVNALVTSHYFIVPTMLDLLSADAIRQFMHTSFNIKTDLKLDLDLLGIVGSMSRTNNLLPYEVLAWDRIRAASQPDGKDANWGDRDYRFVRTVPLRADIAKAAGDGLAYHDNRQIFKPLGDEVWERMFPTPALTDAIDSPQESA
jgi:cellulose biosynthesis protein BcsQ